jgi:uncharacterized protein (DUF433 family)
LTSYLLWGIIDYHSIEGGNKIKQLQRITFDPQIMGGKPCIRGKRVTVGTIVGLIATGETIDDILAAYPYLEREDIMEALSYAAWRAEEREITLAS